MKIELASNYGFCFGVKRAIKIAENTKDATTFGPLIHNKLEIKRLKENYNVGLAEKIDEIEDGSTVVIRTHGIEKKNLGALENSGMNVIDATCPFVTKPQNICAEMSEKGYDIVIFGDESHPEIKGVKSYAKNGATVILNADELDEKRLGSKVALVAQTTRRIEEYQKIAIRLMERCKEVRVFNTICNATFENQDAARELSFKADIMLVIGGKNSSNTKQLFKICQQNCQDSYLIEDENDLDLKWFREKKHCGITAGASTPDWIIQKIINKLQKETS